MAVMSLPLYQPGRRGPRHPLPNLSRTSLQSTSRGSIDVRPLGRGWPARGRPPGQDRSLEVLRLVIPRGKEIPTHKTRGEITVLA